MFYFLGTAILFFLQTLIVFTLPINIFPEFFLFPYLITRNLIPYRDFFDHHGFILYYLLAPLTLDKNLFFLKTVFFLTQSINFVLVSLILKNYASKIGFILGGLIFILLNFFFSDQTLWYENFITTLYLLIFLIILKNKKNHHFLLGVLIAISSLIKPTAAILILPIILLTKSYIIFVSFFFVWLLAILIFSIQNSFIPLVNNLIFFNWFLNLHRPQVNFFDQDFIFISLLMLFLIISFLMIKKKLHLIFIPIVFLISSLIFLTSDYSRYHFVPTATFYAIVIGQSIDKPKRLWEFFFLLGVIFYLLFVFIKTKSQYFYFKKNLVPWIENKTTQSIMNRIKKLKKTNESIFVMGERVEIYYLMNTKPPTYFPLILPLVDEFFEDFDTKIIEGINKSSIIIQTKDKISEKILNRKKIRRIILENFERIEENHNYQIYLRKNSF